MVAAGNGPSIANQRLLQYVTWKRKEVKWTSSPELKCILIWFGPYEATSTPIRKKGMSKKRFKIHWFRGKLRRIHSRKSVSSNRENPFAGLAKPAFLRFRRTLAEKPKKMADIQLNFRRFQTKSVKWYLAIMYWVTCKTKISIELRIMSEPFLGRITELIPITTAWGYEQCIILSEHSSSTLNELPSWTRKTFTYT